MTTSKLRPVALQLPDNFFRRYRVARFASQVDCLQLRPATDNIQQIIVALHGGGFYLPPAPVHFKFYKRLAEATNALVIIPLYPRLPNTTARHTLAMLLRTWHSVLNFATSQALPISILGDSSGGGLALSLLQQFKQRNLPQPRRAVLISPWLDLTLSDPKIDQLTRYDRMLSKQKLAPLAHAYAGSLDLTDPIVSPINGDLTGLAPLLVFGGHHDILMADVWQLITSAQKQGVPLTVWQADDAQHDFILYKSAAAHRAQQDRKSVV